MSISGNLKTMELAELLQWIAQGQKTGSLLVDNGTVRKRVFFVEGKIVASASTDPNEFLGHFLVSHGYLTEKELAKAMAMQATSKMLLGKILVTLGAITEDQLRNLLVMKTEESVYDLFSWDSGEFRFVEDQNLNAGIVPLALDVTALVLQGMSRVDEWRRVREVIVNADVVPVSIAPFPADEISPGEAKILALVDDDRTIREICMHAHASEFQVSKAIFDQVKHGRIKTVRPRLPPTSGPDTGLTGSGKGMRLVNAQALTESAERNLQAGNYSRALRHLRAALSLEPDNQDIEAYLRRVERLITEKLESEGLVLSAVPALKRTAAELASISLSPEEGFALSRVNGNFELRELIQISPMNALDARLVFHKLLSEGHIALQR